MRRPSRRLVVLAGLLAAGALLRLYRLGSLGWAWDEDITALAVRGALDHGWPLLPSGKLYARALPYTWLAALAAAPAGVGEWTLRLVGAVCSLGSVALIFLLGRALERPRAGLLAAALAAISLWEMALARNARMYPLLTLLILALALVWHQGWVRDRLVARLVALPLLAVTVLTHDLGAIFALLFALPLLGLPVPGGLPGMSRPRGLAAWRMPLAAAVVAAGALLTPRALGLVVGARFATLDRHAGSADAAAGVGGLGRVLAGFLRLPRPVLWDAPLAGLLLAVVAVVGAGLIWRQRRSMKRAPGKWGVVDAALDVALLLAVLGHQAVACAAILVLRLMVRRRPGGEPDLPAFVGRVLAVAFGLAAWTALGLLGGAGVREIALGMVELPRRYWWLLAELFPALFTLAVVVTLMRLSMARPPRALILPAYLALGGLLAIGMGASPSFAHRYISPLHPFLLLLAAMHLEDLAGAPGRPQQARWRRPAAAALGLLLVLDVAPPLRLAHKLTQSYARAVPEELGGPWEGFPYYPDEKSPALYVAVYRRPGDRVVAMNWLSFAAYAGPADAWLRTSGYEVQVYRSDGGLRDVYTSALLLSDLPALQGYLAESTSSGRVWLVTSGLEVDRGQRVTPDILEFLARRDDRVVHRAADGRGKVYLFESGAPQSADLGW